MAATLNAKIPEENADPLVLRYDSGGKLEQFPIPTVSKSGPEINYYDYEEWNLGIIYIFIVNLGADPVLRKCCVFAAHFWS